MNTFTIIILGLFIAAFGGCIVNRIFYYINMCIDYWSMRAVLDSKYWFDKGMTIGQALEDMKDAYENSFFHVPTENLHQFKFIPLLNLYECLVFCFIILQFIVVLCIIIYKIIKHIIINIIYKYFITYLINIVKCIHNKFVIILNLLYINKVYMWIESLYKRMMKVILDIRIS